MMKSEWLVLGMVGGQTTETHSIYCTHKNSSCT